MLLTLRTKSHHCASFSVPVQRQQQTIHKPLPVGKWTPSASLGPCLWDHRTTGLFRPEKAPKPICSLPGSTWTGSGWDRHQTETPSYARLFPDHGRVGNGPGHSNNGSENSESTVRHGSRRALPEILVKIWLQGTAHPVQWTCGEQSH